MNSDEQLANLAQRGDKQAFGELVDRYQERLLRFLTTRGATRADAEDALQDAFCDAWRYLHSYDSRWRFSTWLYRIALRRIARQPAAADGIDADTVAGGDDPLAACIAESERENIWVVAKRELAPEACSALWLHYVEELPVKDVARALDRSLAWAKVSLMRSRRTLRAAMNTEASGKAGREIYGRT